MPAVRLALTCGSGDFKGYVAVAAYYVDLPRGSNDGSAMRADVLDAAILTGAAPAFNGRGRFAALVILRLGFDLEHRFAAGCYILYAGLLSQPFGGFFAQCRDRPAVSGVVLNVQAMSLSGFLEFLIVVLFPEPDAPTNATNSPGLTDRLMPSKALTMFSPLP